MKTSPQKDICSVADFTAKLCIVVLKSVSSVSVYDHISAVIYTTVVFCCCSKRLIERCGEDFYLSKFVTSSGHEHLDYANACLIGMRIFGNLTVQLRAVIIAQFIIFEKPAVSSFVSVRI